MVDGRGKGGYWMGWFRVVLVRIAGTQRRTDILFYYYNILFNLAALRLGLTQRFTIQKSWFKPPSTF